MSEYVPDTGMLDHAERIRTAVTAENNALLEALRLRYAELQIEAASVQARMSEVRSMIDQISTPRRQRRSRTQQPPSDEPASS